MADASLGLVPVRQRCPVGSNDRQTADRQRMALVREAPPPERQRSVTGSLTAPGVPVSLPHRPPWISEDGRHQSYVGHDGWTHSPPGDEARLVRWLAELDDYRRGRAQPGSVAQLPRDDRELAARRQRTASECVSRQRAVATSRAAAAPPVLDRAQTLASSDPEEIDVAQAAVLARVHPERIRQLARAGRLDARKAARDTWVVNRASLVAYLDDRRRSGRGTGSSTGPAEEAAHGGREAG